MILTCNKCSATFSVPDNAIGPNGRLVRCSKCKNEWVAVNPIFLKNEEEENTEQPTSTPTAPIPSVTEEPPLPPPIKEIPTITPNPRRVLANKPKEEKTPFYQWRSVLITLYTLLALVFFGTFSTALVIYRVSIVNNVPAMQHLYNLFNLYQNDKLVFEKISIQQNKLEKLLKVSIPIRNIGDKSQKMAYLRVTVFNEKMHKISSMNMPQHMTIKPKAPAITLEYNLTNVPAKATYISVEIGNRIDFMLHGPKVITKVALNKMHTKTD